MKDFEKKILADLANFADLKRNIVFMIGMVNLCEAAARLERKSFFASTHVLLKWKMSGKKDWERKAEKLPK